MSEIDKQVAEQIAKVSAVLASTSLLLQQVLGGSMGLGGPSGTFEARKPKDYRLLIDEQGREIDAQGNLKRGGGQGAAAEIGNLKTLKANMESGAERTVVHNPYLMVGDRSDASAVTDPRLRARRREKKAAQSFVFVEQGKYVKQGDAARARDMRRKLASFGSQPMAEVVNEVAAVTVDTAVEGADEAAAVPAPPANEFALRDGTALPPAPDFRARVPGMEWWDEPFLPVELQQLRLSSAAERQNRSYDRCSAEHSRFHTLVHHPAPVSSKGGEKEVLMPFYLTKRDRKRIRRQARTGREQEKQDKVALGLVPPPEPKFKLSNFMKVLGEHAVSDPSKMEKRVLAQVAQRATNHEMRNEARKLTPQEQREKRRRKLCEDTTLESHVALFRLASLSDQQQRFKIDVNAQQNSLTGGVLICASPGEEVALVVVEGGPKAIKRFSKLMMNRIQWAPGDEEAHDGEAGAQADASLCRLVWEGVVVKRAFTAFRFQECKTAATARKVMEAKGVAHYWDMVLKEASTE